MKFAIGGMLSGLLWGLAFWIVFYPIILRKDK